MVAYVEGIEKKKVITIDGYTSNKTINGIVRDVARAIKPYSENEAQALLDALKFGIDENNTPFVKSADSCGGYFFEYEEVPCATRYNEETDEIEYKEGFKNYFCIQIVK